MAGPGNPKGVGRKKGVPNKQHADVRLLALEFGPRAIQCLAELMLNSADDKTKAMAANSLLDRAYGKAKQHVDTEHRGQITISWEK